MKRTTCVASLAALAAAVPVFGDGLSLAPSGDVLVALVTPQPANPQRVYQPLPEDEDWRFLKNPTDHDLFDPIKYIPLGSSDLTLSVGGSARVRYENKINAAFGATSAASPVKSDSYFLERAYIHTDLRYMDFARFFAEGDFAYMDGADGARRNPPPTPFPSDDADLHQLFLDLSPFNLAKDGFGLTLRLGRQELLLDRQKLVGPLDWANVRRTWDGASVTLAFEQYVAELFWVRPVNVNPKWFDTTDDQTNFIGAHLTHPLINKDNHYALFAYYLNSSRDSKTAFAPLVTNFNPDGKAGDTDRVTLGGRAWGKLPANFDYDVEGGLQLGKYAGNDIWAGYFSGELGYTFADVWAKPRLSAGYDYASGDSGRDQQANTFNQLFPTGHLFFGNLDLVGRQNIDTVNVTLAATPLPELKVWAAWHYFALASVHDALYNAAGAALRFSPTGNAGTDVGHEFDLNASYQLGRHTTLSAGYGIFLPGAFIQHTGKSQIPQMFYTSVEFKF